MIKKSTYQTAKATIAIALFLSFTFSCSTDSGKNKQLNISGNWELKGLTEVEINNINPMAESLLISTNKGLYSKNESMELIGLEDQVVVDVIKIGTDNLIAATQASDFANGDTTIYKKERNRNWAAYIKNYGGEDGIYTWISNLELNPKNENILFATGGANIAMSNDSGKSWMSVFYDWGTIGFTSFIAFDSDKTNIIWAGGSILYLNPL